MPSRVPRPDPLDKTRRRTWRAIRSILSWVETERLMTVARDAGRDEPATLAALSAASGFVAGADPSDFALFCVAGSVLVRTGETPTVFSTETEEIAVARWRVRRSPEGNAKSGDRRPVFIGPGVAVGFVRVEVAT